jgi:cell division protein FtsB
MQRRPLSLRITLVGLGLALVLLQLRLWASEDGFAEVHRLREQVEARRQENAALAERNARLSAEVRDLKRGASALEERARSDLGFVAPDESFYIIGDIDYAD